MQLQIIFDAAMFDLWQGPSTIPRLHAPHISLGKHEMMGVWRGGGGHRVTTFYFEFRCYRLAPLPAPPPPKLPSKKQQKTTHRMSCACSPFSVWMRNSDTDSQHQTSRSQCVGRRTSNRGMASVLFRIFTLAIKFTRWVTANAEIKVPSAENPEPQRFHPIGRFSEAGLHE